MKDKKFTTNLHENIKGRIWILIKVLLKIKYNEQYCTTNLVQETYVAEIYFRLY